MVIVRSLRITHLTIYAVLICTFAVAAFGRRNKIVRGVGAFGVICTSPCERTSQGYACRRNVKYGDKNLLGYSYDFCSPIEGLDYRARECIPNVCYIRHTKDNKKYNFCYLEEKTYLDDYIDTRKRGYCSTERDPRA